MHPQIYRAPYAKEQQKKDKCESLGHTVRTIVDAAQMGM